MKQWWPCEGVKRWQCFWVSLGQQSQWEGRRTGLSAYFQFMYEAQKEQRVWDHWDPKTRFYQKKTAVRILYIGKSSPVHGAISSFKANFEENISVFTYEVVCKQIYFSSPVVYNLSNSVLYAHYIFPLLPLPFNAFTKTEKEEAIKGLNNLSSYF